MRRLRRLISEDNGFTLAAVMISMTLLGVIAVSAFTAATGDIPLARKDQDRKRAYQAAQAGVDWYSFQLQRDPTYWEKCATGLPTVGGAQAPVELEGARAVWTTLVASQEQFTIEQLDHRTDSGTRVPCSVADPSSTGLQDGLLRIRSTGRVNGESRSIVATFKRKGFLDFIYFTQWETQDPILSGVSNCDNPRGTRSSSCTEIQFAPGDVISGPLHTNDVSIVACGSPTFGRVGKSDNFEVAGRSPGYIGSSGCGSVSPVFNGPKVTPATTLTAPNQNSALASEAGPSWTFYGDTCLVFKSNQTVDVYSTQNWASTGRVTCTGTPTNKPLTGTGAPPNGVIYVDQTTGQSASCTYSKYEDYDQSRYCGDVAVSGTYSSNLTIGSRNDIVVNGNLTRTGNGMLGLVASNFIRIYHPMSNLSSGNCGSNVSGFTPITNVDAAMLSLQHSFQVDNYHCGSPLGTLTVNGAIAQYYRGTVGTSSGGSAATGYIKDYNYDDRLRYRSPPNFLDPVETSWVAIRRSEQSPAAY